MKTTLAVLALIGLLTGCAPTATISSNKAADFKDPLKKLFVGTVVYKYLPSDDSAAFSEHLKNGLLHCGVSAYIYNLYDVSDAAKGKMFAEVQKYAPQAYMTIVVSSYKNGPGAGREVNLEVTLQDTKTQRMVWKSLLSVSKNGFAGSGEGGSVISDAILARMQQDALFATRCVQPAS